MATSESGRVMPRKERLKALDDALADLRRYRSTWSEQEFLTSRDAQRMVLQAMYVAVQACVDEALASCRARDQQPDSYREAFLALGEMGLLDADLAVRLADWASFRNVLAHFYPVIDLRRVYDALGEIGDLAAFRKWIVED